MKDKKTIKKKSAKIANIVFWVVLAIVAIYSVVALTSTDDNVTSIFGQTAFTVQSNSMSPTFEKGDLIYVETDFELSEIEVGDVITYDMIIQNADGSETWIFNSHRVTEITLGTNGYYYFYTQGDNNSEPDSGYLTENFVRGVWNEKVTKNIGGVIDGIVGFLKSGTGFFIFIVLPCFGFLVYEIYRFIIVMTEYKTHQILESRVKLQEEAVALAKKQLEEEARQKALQDK
jgi:signal peptidase